MANLKKYTEGKDAYQLHLGMAEECMKIFSARKLIDISSLEQVGPVDISFLISCA